MTDKETLLREINHAENMLNGIIEKLNGTELTESRGILLKRLASRYKGKIEFYKGILYTA